MMLRRSFFKMLGAALATLAAAYVPGRPWEVLGASHERADFLVAQVVDQGGCIGELTIAIRYAGEKTYAFCDNKMIELGLRRIGDKPYRVERILQYAGTTNVNDPLRRT